ncbi:hypothetical protein Hanom_Chr05g00439431 [Helianthus anomalus]
MFYFFNQSYLMPSSHRKENDRKITLKTTNGQETNTCTTISTYIKTLMKQLQAIRLEESKYSPITNNQSSF